MTRVLFIKKLKFKCVCYSVSLGGEDGAGDAAMRPALVAHGTAAPHATHHYRL